MALASLSGSSSSSSCSSYEDNNSNNDDFLLPLSGGDGSHELRIRDKTTANTTTTTSNTKSKRSSSQQRRQKQKQKQKQQQRQETNSNKKNWKNLFTVLTEARMKRVSIATIIKSAFKNKNNKNQKHEEVASSSSSSTSSSSLSFKKCRNVCFYPYVKVRDIPHINDLPQDVIDECYLSKDELWSIHDDCREIMFQCGMNSSHKDFLKEGYALRGLDKRTWKYCVKRDEIHDQVQDAVYQYQRIQRLTGKDKTQIMAETCTKLSHPAVVSAQIAAISDIFTCHHDTWIQRNIPTIESVPVHGKMTLG